MEPHGATRGAQTMIRLRSGNCTATRTACDEGVVNSFGVRGEYHAEAVDVRNSPPQVGAAAKADGSMAAFGAAKADMRSI